MRPITLADALRENLLGYVEPGLFFSAYEWFARRLQAWDTKSQYRHVLIDTSGIGYSGLEPLYGPEHPRQILAKLAKYVGTDCASGRFLRHCGFRRWADVAKPIPIAGRVPRINTHWFDLLGLTFRHSPNDCHPRATAAYSGALAFCLFDRRWRFEVEYGYPDECKGGSSWKVRHKQRPGQSLWGFCESIDPWLKEQLLDGEPPMTREHRYRQLTARMKAIDGVFHENLSDKLKDRLTALLGMVKTGGIAEGKVVLTDGRFAVIRKWLSEDRKARAKK